MWGDFDNDGFPDLFVTQYGKNVLYRNNGNGTFTDVTDKAGVGGMVDITWPSGQRQTFRDVEADKFYVVEEGKDELGMHHSSGRQP